MGDSSANSRSTKPRILMFSQRNIFRKHYRCSLYEFEDIIQQIDSVELLAPRPNRYFNYGTRIANRFATRYAMPFNPGIPPKKIRQDYDLFFVVCMFPKDLLHIRAIDGWKEHCKTSICWLNEIWISEFFKYRSFLKALSEFDHVILNLSHSVNGINKVIGGKCFYLPPGTDAIQFCPYPEAPRRFIDVYSIGRRSQETHRCLLRMANDKKIFYVYDTIDGEGVLNPNEHRFLLANMAKRSRYFMVNPGKIDSPDETKGQIEVGPRYFEGAAAGAIMIGEYPNNSAFTENFSWPDAVIHLPFGSDIIDTIITELDKQPDRQAKIRRDNVVESLLRHDWVYRWEKVLETVGLAPMPGLLERKKRLEILSRLV